MIPTYQILLGVIFIISSWIIHRAFKKKGGFFDLYFLFNALTIFSCLVIPAINEIYEFSRNSVTSSDRAKILYLIFISTYLSIAILIQPFYYYIAPPHKNSPILKTKTSFYLWASTPFFVLAALSTLELIEKIQTHGYQAFLANRIIFLSGNAQIGLFIFFPILFITAYCLERFILSKKTFSKANFLIATLVIAATSLPMLLLGGRSNLFFGILILLASSAFLYSRTDRKNDLHSLYKASAIALAIIIFAANALGAIRQEIMRGNFENRDTESQKIPLEGVIVALSSYENLYIIFDQKDIGYLYGKTIFSFITGVIPRSFYPEKPVGSGPVMKNIIAPGSYDLIHGENITSVTTGLPTESFLNFGWLGAILMPILMLILISLSTRFAQRASTALEVIASGAISLRIISYINGEFFGVSMHIITILLFLFTVKAFSFINKSLLQLHIGHKPHKIS